MKRIQPIYNARLFLKPRWLFLPLLFIIPVMASSCGGGGDVSLAGGGIGGSGYTSVGAVTALGSIFVNGVEFQTAGASVTLNGVSADEKELQVGMVVKVAGSVNADGKTGKADRVVFAPNVAGPVSSIDHGRNTLHVMGQTVFVDGQTAFAGLSGSSAGLSGIGVNDPVEISGLTDADGSIRATRITRKAAGFPFEVNGRVTNLTSVTFRFNNLTIDYSKLAAGGIQDGDCVTVRGALTSSTTLSADYIERKVLDAAEDSPVEIEGFITNLSYSGMWAGGFAIYTPYGHHRVEFDASTGCSGGRLDTMKAGARVKVHGTIRNNTIHAGHMMMM